MLPKNSLVTLMILTAILSACTQQRPASGTPTPAIQEVNRSEIEMNIEAQVGAWLRENAIPTLGGFDAQLDPAFQPS
jgi:hypothetical protein